MMRIEIMTHAKMRKRIKALKFDFDDYYMDCDISDIMADAISNAVKYLDILDSVIPKERIEE